jgi:hypothetical protein
VQIGKRGPSPSNIQAVNAAKPLVTSRFADLHDPEALNCPAANPFE